MFFGTLVVAISVCDSRDVIFSEDTRTSWVVTSTVIVEKSSTVPDRNALPISQDFFPREWVIPPGTSGCPIVHVHKSIVWRLYPLHHTRDKVREPAGGHRSLDPSPRCSRFALLRGRSLAINLSLSDCFHVSSRLYGWFANLPPDSRVQSVDDVQLFPTESRTNYCTNDADINSRER